MLSNQKSNARVNLLSTCCNYVISIGFHSRCLIQFVGWLYFNLNIHSCNTCRKSQKNTSCKSLNTYLSRLFCCVNFGFMLSFYSNSISFVFNQLSIFSSVGFHGLNIPFYIIILLTYCRLIKHYFDASLADLIHSIPSCSNQPAMEPFVGFLLFYFFIYLLRYYLTFIYDQGSYLTSFQQNFSKTIGPSGKP
jgi:hypothetical protein